MKKIKITLYILLAFLSFSSLAQAAFEENYWSARVGALAGAFHAISNDATGVFYNMAATNKTQSKQANFSYARLFAGLDEVSLSMRSCRKLGNICYKVAIAINIIIWLYIQYY